MAKRSLVDDSSMNTIDAVRGRLVAKIDEVISQLATSESTPVHSLLQIEANLVSQTTKGTNRRIVLDTIDVDELRHHAKDSGSSSSWSTPTNTEFHGGLPSPRHFKSIGLFTGHSGDTLNSKTQSATSTPSTMDAKDVSSQSGSETTPQHSQQPSKRRKLNVDANDLGKPIVDRLIEGIWEQIHKPGSLAMGEDLAETISLTLERLSNITTSSTDSDFGKVTQYCRQITTGSRATRIFEVIVQAYWVDCYDARLAIIRAASPRLRLSESKKIVMNEACSSFSWSEKELRNRLSIWRGYQEIKAAAGWPALIFAGPGIYKFCKYRLCFDEPAIAKLRCIKSRIELAADTLQPQWRSLLSLVGQSSRLQWNGHPHDWTVSIKDGGYPIPLAKTYVQWDPDFSFEHVQDSIIDNHKWDTVDPRRCDNGPEFTCKSCTLKQSAVAEENECQCFLDLYSPITPKPCPVQIFQTENGKNNGLIACCSFEPGQAVGEFVGMITQGLADVDVMQSQAGDYDPYQIWQGKYGNYTRFMNHSCVPNCEFQTFSWLGIQRIVVVSRGVPAGKEITVDYSNRYWDNLDKICLCGEPACQYRDRS